MLYIELYLYDYLKKKANKIKRAELWGERRGNDFFICCLRMEGEKKAFCKEYKQYLGNYLGLEDEDGDRKVLVYEKNEKICRQKIAIYVAKETGQIEHFLIRESAKTRRKVVSMQNEMPKTSIKERGEGISAKMAACAMLIFLAANMVEALSSYENMHEVIEVVEMLFK